MRAQLDEAHAAADRLVREAAAPGRGGRRASARRVPPRGWDDRRGRDGATPDCRRCSTLLDAVRDAVPAELSRQLAEALRELLLAVRALIDWYLERLGEPGPGARRRRGRGHPARLTPPRRRLESAVTATSPHSARSRASCSRRRAPRRRSCSRCSCRGTESSSRAAADAAVGQPLRLRGVLVRRGRGAARRRGRALPVWARSQRKAFHLPGRRRHGHHGAGAWASLLLVWRLFDRPDVADRAATVGIQWGMFVALLVAGVLTAAGARVRAAHRPEPPNPAADDAGWERPAREPSAAPSAAPARGRRRSPRCCASGRAGRASRPRRPAAPSGGRTRARDA